MKIAIDIGTTTVVFALIGPDKTILNSTTCLNRQAVMGKDVISRIKAANEGQAEQLQILIQKTLKEGILHLLASPPIGLPLTMHRIERITIAANTTMVHLLLNYSCETLGTYPFTSEHLDAIQTDFVSILPQMAETGWMGPSSLGIEPSTPVYFLPGISVFIGGDLTGGLIASGLDTGEAPALLLDLGTNGEMVLGNRMRMLATSAAAGPAFEGMGKTYGSEILHAVSSMLKQGIIDETGLLREPYFLMGYPYTTSAGQRIMFHQKNIRNLQAAKAAIRSGITILCELYGIQEHELSVIYLSGHFGSATDPADAVSIGLFPEGIPVIPLGNSSLHGAIEADAISPERITAIQEKTEEQYLANSPAFPNYYIQNLNFPSRSKP